MAGHELTQLIATTGAYQERVDNAQHAGQVKVWSAAKCSCGQQAFAYLWIEETTLSRLPDAVLDMLERCGRDALALHQLHKRTTSDD